MKADEKLRRTVEILEGIREALERTPATADELRVIDAEADDLYVSAVHLDEYVHNDEGEQ